MGDHPHPTKTLITRLRRHATALANQRKRYPHAEVICLTPEASSGIRNTCLHAAGRLEDLAEARRMLKALANAPHSGETYGVNRGLIFEFLERTGGWE